MKDFKIEYQVKINTGENAGRIMTIHCCLSDHETQTIADILIERGILKCWCNDNEYELRSREIILS